MGDQWGTMIISSTLPAVTAAFVRQVGQDETVYLTLMTVLGTAVRMEPLVWMKLPGTGKYL